MDIALVAAFIGGLFTAWVVGVNNSSTFGPVNAAGAVPIFRGSLIVGVASLLGAVTQGGAVANTVGNGLVSGVSFSATIAAIILLTAAILIIVSTLSNLPMPSAFLLVGGSIGAGIAAGGAINTGTITTIVSFWLIIPIVGLVIGYLSALGTRRFIPNTDKGMRMMKYVLLILGTYTAYTAGANRAGLPIGPLVNTVDVPLFTLLVFAGIGMMIGAWTGSPRIIQAVAQDYSRMGPRRAVGALLSASLIAQAATIFGVPISFNQTVIFSVIGSGLVEGTGGVGTRKIVFTVAAWTFALFLAMGITYGLTTLLA